MPLTGGESGGTRQVGIPDFVTQPPATRSTGFQGLQPAPRTSDGKIDHSQIPEPTTAGFGGFGNLKLPPLPAPSLNTSGLLSSIGKAFAPKEVEKQVGPGLRRGIAEPLQKTAKETPKFLQPFTNFFRKDVPETTTPAINTSINKPLQDTGSKAPGFLSGITNFFSRSVPEATTPVLQRQIPGQFGALNRTATTSIGGITNSLTGMPRLSADAIERRLPGQFGAMSGDANRSIGRVTGALTGMPGETRDPIERGIAGQFATASSSSMSSVARISASFRSVQSVGISAALAIASSFSRIGSSLVSSVRSGMNNVFNTLRNFRIPYTNIRPFSGLPRFNLGGVVPGVGNADTVAAMLTPGEFVIRKDSVQKYGMDILEKLNEGTFDFKNLSAPSYNVSSGQTSPSVNSSSTKSSASVYNNSYSISVNVKSESNPDQIARTVIDQIKTIDSQRIRGSRF
jgi:hypothetical protein